MKHLGTVTLETERLILRRYVQEDAEAIFRNLHTKVGDSAEAIKVFFTQNRLESYIYLESYQWVVVLKSIGEPIGTVRADCVDTTRRSLEIGYEIGNNWWHQGIISEAVKRVVTFFFEEVGINRIAARHNTTNPRSGDVMINAGMRLEGIQRQASKTGCDVLCYAILSEDYFNRAKSDIKLDAGFWTAINKLISESKVIIDRPKGDKASAF